MDRDVLLSLLQQQLSGRASVTESLASMVGTDPELAPITQLLAQREAQLQRQLEEDDANGTDDLVAEQQREERRRRGEAIRAFIEQQAAELDAVRLVLDDVAAALGACPSCFGADPQCRWCRGRGTPGFMPPEPDSFERLVLPALRVQARLRRNDNPHRERKAS